MTDPKQAAPLLRAIDEYTGSFIVKSALQLAPLVFVRPGELRQAEWEHIDLETKEWRYLVTKTQTPRICRNYDHGTIVSEAHFMSRFDGYDP
jgi:integrase